VISLMRFTISTCVRGLRAVRSIDLDQQHILCLGRAEERKDRRLLYSRRPSRARLDFDCGGRTSADRPRP